MDIDIGTGDTENIKLICHRYLETAIIPMVPNQCGLIQLHMTPEQICAQFPIGIVETICESDFDNYKSQPFIEHSRLLVFSYRDGFQNFVGPTRDY